MKEDIILLETNTELPFFVHMCGISYCDGSYEIKRPDSPISVIEYIISGCGVVNENDSSFIAKKGDIYFLKAKSNHHYYSDDKYPWVKIWMNFGGVLSEKIIECYNLENKNHFYAPELKGYFDEIYNIAKRKDEYENISEDISAAFLKLAQKLSRIKTQANIYTSPIALKLKKAIDNNADFSKSFSELIKNLYCSENHAIREFHKEYGTTPYAYILNKKFEYACILLKNSTLSVSLISEKLGFCDMHYFSSCFKKKYGITPSEFKKGKKLSFSEKSII